jgi:hypothetical protein
MRTYQALHQNEIRAISLKIRDDNGDAYEPDSAYVTINDKDGTEIVEETAAVVSGNVVYSVIDTTTTGTENKYKITWKILKDDYTFYHRTNIEVISV